MYKEIEDFRHALKPQKGDNHISIDTSLWNTNYRNELSEYEVVGISLHDNSIERDVLTFSGGINMGTDFNEASQILTDFEKNESDYSYSASYFDSGDDSGSEYIKSIRYEWQKDDSSLGSLYVYMTNTQGMSYSK